MGIRFRSIIFLCVVVVGNLSLLGCASKIKLAVVGSFVQDVSTASARDDDVDMVLDAAPAYLLMLEGLLVSNPDNVKLLTGTAQMYVAYGSMVELDSPERAVLAYAHAKRHALKALAHNKDVARLLNRPFDEFEQIPAHLSHRDVPVVFAAASSWGAWISVNTGSMAALAEVPKVTLLMEWVLKQDETYLNGGPHLFLGLIKAALPPAYGGQPEVAREHFQRAYEISGGHSLMPRVLIARYYARQTLDRDLYVRLLREVLAAPVDTDPQLTLQNAAARRQARRLLEETDEYF